MDNNNTNNNKPNNKVNMPKFNLNWLYMIIALMLLGLWWSSDSRGSGSKVVPYSDFQKYVTNGYISKVLGSEKTLEAHVKPNAVGAIFGADSTKVGRNPIIPVTLLPRTDWINFCRTKKQPVILTESQITLPIRIFSRQS